MAAQVYVPSKLALAIATVATYVPIHVCTYNLSTYIAVGECQPTLNLV